jgi:hypothetical protein
MIRRALVAGVVGIALGGALGYAQAPVVYSRTPFTEAQRDHLVRYCIIEQELPTSMVSSSGTMQTSQESADAVLGFARAGGKVAACLMAYDEHGKRFEMSLMPVTTTTAAGASKGTLGLINVDADTCVIVASTSNGVERNDEDDLSPMYVVDHGGEGQAVWLQAPVYMSIMECHLDRGDTFTVTLLGQNDERQDLKISPADWKKPDGSSAGWENPDEVAADATADRPNDTTVFGEVVALNHTIKQTKESDTIEVAPGDDVSFTLTLENTSEQTITGALLYPQTIEPKDAQPRHRELNFVVSRDGSAEGPPVEGANLGLNAPESDNCVADWSFWNSDFSVDGEQLVQHTSWSGTSQEGIDTLAPVELPPLEPEEEVVITGTLGVSGSNAPGQIDGTGVEFRVVPADDGIGRSSDYSTTGDVKIGDTIRALIRLHDGSCSAYESQVTVSASVGPFDPKTGSLQLSAVSTGETNVDPRMTEFTPAVLLVDGQARATLEPVDGTTKLYGMSCDGAELIEELPDWLFRVGVGVSVPAYVPRMTCESHMRYVTTDLRVVPPAGR